MLEPKGSVPLTSMSFGGLESVRQAEHVQQPKWLHILWTQLLTNTKGIERFSFSRNRWANCFLFDCFLFCLQTAQLRTTRVGLAPESTGEQTDGIWGLWGLILRTCLDSTVTPGQRISNPVITAWVTYKLTLPVEVLTGKLKGWTCISRLPTRSDIACSWAANIKTYHQHCWYHISWSQPGARACSGSHLCCWLMLGCTCPWKQAPSRSLPRKYCELAALQGALQLLLLSARPVIPFISTLSCKQINMPIPWDTWLSLYLRLAIRVCALDIDFYCLSYHSTKGHLIAVSFSTGGVGEQLLPALWLMAAISTFQHKADLLEAPFTCEVHCHTSEAELQLRWL